MQHNVAKIAFSRNPSVSIACALIKAFSFADAPESIGRGGLFLALARFRLSGVDVVAAQRDVRIDIGRVGQLSVDPAYGKLIPIAVPAWGQPLLPGVRVSNMQAESGAYNSDAVSFTRLLAG